MVLERKLLELYGLKEQQEFIAQMHWHLEEKMTEIDMLGVTVKTLRDEIKNIQEEIKQNIFAKSQLEKAKRTVEDLEKKMDVNAGHMKQQLVMLEEQVSEIQCSKGNYSNNGMNEKKLKAAKHVELEYVEMQRINKELELEKRELTVKLVGAQARIISVSNMTQVNKNVFTSPHLFLNIKLIDKGNLCFTGKNLGKDRGRDENFEAYQ